MSDLFLFRSALKDLFRVKKLAAVCFLVVLPLVIALMWRSAGGSEKFVAAEVYNRLSELLIFGFILTMLACVFGTGVISQEVEQKTIVYLLTRPVPRWRILLMKFAAAFLATTLAVWVATLLLALGTYGLSGWGQSPLGRDLLILPLASLAYGGLFLFLATLFTRPLVVGLLYAFGIETWMPSLPGNFKMLSLMSYLRVLAPHKMPDPTPAPDDPFVQALIKDSLTPALSWGVVIGVIVVTLFLALLVFSTNEYVPREDV